MSVVVSGLGMVSSIGRDVVTACAALRAGLTRPFPLAHAEVLDLDEGDVVPVVGHPMRGFSDGFYLIGVWVRLGTAALADLLRYAKLPPQSESGFWSRTGAVFVTPYVDEGRFPDAELLAPERILADYAQQILAAVEATVRPDKLFLICEGHAGTARAVQGAMQLIESGQLDRVLVVATDSYVDTPTLDWLAEHDRLKVPDSPASVMPGEASACLLLESAAHAAQRGARVEAVVVAAATGREPNHFFAADVSTGIQLSSVVEQVLGEGDQPFKGDLLADLNGEPWRAYELACARVRLTHRLADDVRLVLPASSLGETGAASGAVGVCVAVRSFARANRVAGEALVVSSSEHGHVGAVRLASPTPVSA